jgi:hypothetical protein
MLVKPTLETVDVEYTLPWKTLRLEMLGNRCTLRVVWRDDANVLAPVVASHEMSNRLHFGAVLSNRHQPRKFRRRFMADQPSSFGRASPLDHGLRPRSGHTSDS